MTYENFLELQNTKQSSKEAEAVWYLATNRSSLYRVAEILGVYLSFPSEDKIEVYDDEKHHKHRKSFIGENSQNLRLDFMYWIAWDFTKVRVLMELVIGDFDD